MSGMDRATFLRRAGGAAAAVAVAGAGGGAGSLLGQARRGRKPPLSELAGATSGALITQGSAGYQAAKREVNTRYSGIRPLAILRARSVADVQAAVRWCNKHDVRIAARSGGHSYAGYSTVQGGLIVNLTRLNAIKVASDGTTAQVGAGNRLIDMYTSLADRGLTVPGGSCPTVGVGGLSLGGGVGLAGRALGTTSDNIASLQIVTANGKTLTCNARQNAEPLLGLPGRRRRELRHRHQLHLHHPRRPLGLLLHGDLRLERRRDVVARWQRWAPNAPAELFSLCSLGTGSGGPRSASSASTWARRRPSAGR